MYIKRIGCFLSSIACPENGADKAGGPMRRVGDRFLQMAYRQR